MSERIIVEEQEKIHKFYDIHDNQKDTYCIVNINVKKFYYNQEMHVERIRYYYDITYYYDYFENGIEISKNTDYHPYSKISIQKTNPFYYYRNHIDDDSIEGVITLSNMVTNALVKQLMMDDDELEIELSNRWVIQYRTQLMYILSTLWD